LTRTILAGLALITALIAALFLVPRFRDTRLMLGAGLARAGLVVGLDSEDVEFQSANATLSGTVVFPKQSPPSAAIVIIHGAGRNARMLWLARLFASEGIAVLTYDKRGVGKSGGVYEDDSRGHFSSSQENLDLLARDAAAAATVIARHPRAQGARVGYAGISQGGWIGPIAATKPPAVAFMAFFNGPVATVSEQGHFGDLAANDADFWKTHSHQEVAEYMKAVRYRADDVDPRASLLQLRIPVFWTFGGQDNVVPVDLSVSRLEELIARGHDRFQYKIYPEYGHELPVFDFSRLSLPRPFKDSVDWIKRTAGQSAQHALSACCG